jgi:hypothetical protein
MTAGTSSANRPSDGAIATALAVLAADQAGQATFLDVSLDDHWRSYARATLRLAGIPSGQVDNVPDPGFECEPAPGSNAIAAAMNVVQPSQTRAARPPTPPGDCCD